MSGQPLWIPEEELKSLGDEDYYYFQIVGCTVLTGRGETIGTVKAIEVIAGNELLVVEREGREIYIPFAASICTDIDPAARKIVVDPPEGLLDLNEI